MTKKFISANENNYATDILLLMQENKINSLPVINSKNKLIGAINMHILINSGIT